LSLESLIFTNFFSNCLVFADDGATPVATTVLWRGGGDMAAATTAAALSVRFRDLHMKSIPFFECD
jgi:hypothetical protein